MFWSKRKTVDERPAKAEALKLVEGKSVDEMEELIRSRMASFYVAALAGEEAPSYHPSGYSSSDDSLKRGWDDAYLSIPGAAFVLHWPDAKCFNCETHNGRKYIDLSDAIKAADSLLDHVWNEWCSGYGDGTHGEMWIENNGKKVWSSKK
jgi:hypothetical protein